MIQCPVCKSNYEMKPEKCYSCGYPFKASEHERSIFVAHQVLKKGKITDTKDSIKKTQVILFILAAFNIVLPIIRYNYGTYDDFIYIIHLTVGLVFLSCGLFVKKHPFIFILIPFIILVLFYLLSAVINPVSIISGIVWKALFLGSTGYSLISIIRSEKFRKESKHLSTVNYK